jgi:sulfide:quinone oxidoreductase
MPSNPPTSANTNEDIQLPAGPIVRIRALRPGDEQAVQSLLASPEAMRIGAAGGGEAGEQGTLVADLPWGGRIIGLAAWGRLSGPRAAVTITVARSFARWPVASHLLARLARLADAALIPTLVVTGADGGDDFEHVLAAGFGAAPRADGGVEVATREWPAALASLEHRSDPFLGADDPQPATAPRVSSKMPEGRVVIAGGGVAALECLMALRDLGGPDHLPIQLVAADEAFTYRPLQIAEPFSLGTARRHPLSRVAGDFGADLVIDAVVEVRGERRQAICASGAVLDYDALVLAPGARREPAYEHAITFGADPSHGALHELLIALEDGRVKDVAFVVPPDIAWSLPLYELALMTARDLMARGIHDVHLSLVTPESRPLAIFGPQVSGAVSGLLDAAGVDFVGGSYADVRRGAIRLEPGGRTMEIDEAIALPVLRGPTIAGVPADRAGFIPTDPFGAVAGLPGVFAAGDATTFPVKQGGLAAQQADAVAQSVAAALGAPLAPRPFRPVLRGLLFAGDEDRFLRSSIGGGEGDGTSSGAALWWPPSKIAGLYLAPYLYRQAGWGEREPRRGFQEVEVPLEHVI